MLGDSTDAQCVANLKAEINTLQDENHTLYEKIKRMEKSWDGLLKQTTAIESSRSRLEWEISKTRGDLHAKTQLLQQMDAQNAELQAAVIAAGEENKKLNENLHHRLEEVHAFKKEAQVVSDKYSHNSKAWKEEKRAMGKQREEITRKLDACEDELQAYFNENAKLEKQLKQITKEFTTVTQAHNQIQEILDTKETNWQRFVRRLGHKHESMQDMYKAALSSGFCLVESGGLSPAGVLMANYVQYWNVLNAPNVKQMVYVINSLRDFLIEHFLDQDSLLYLLSCTSLVIYSLHAVHGMDLDEQIIVRLDDYHLLEQIGIQTNVELYCGSGYSSDSSDYNTEGTAGYNSDAVSVDSYATDSTDSSSGTSRSKPETPAKKSASRGKSVLNLRAPAGMLNLVKPLLFKRPPRREVKSSSKPPLMSDTDASCTGDSFSETSTGTPRLTELFGTPRARTGNSTPRASDTSGYNTPRGSESGYTSTHNLSDSGYASPRGSMKDSGGVATPRGRTRRNGGNSWEVTIRNTEEFFFELDFMFAMTLAALLKKIYKRLDELLEFSHIEDSFAHFCAFRANDHTGQPPARFVLGELTDLFNSLVSSFEVHMVYFSLAQKVFEEIFGRLSKTLANIVIARNSMRCDMFGNFLMVIWERLETLCRGNEWTGNANRQLSLIKQCAMLLNLKDKSLVENARKREATFPDLNENQIRHIITPELHTGRPHSNSNPSPYSPRRGPHETSVTAKLLLFPDLDYVKPFAIRVAHYLGLDELQKLPVPPFLVETLA